MLCCHLTSIAEPKEVAWLLRKRQKRQRSRLQRQRLVAPPVNSGISLPIALPPTVTRPPRRAIFRETSALNQPLDCVMRWGGDVEWNESLLTDSRPLSEQRRMLAEEALSIPPMASPNSHCVYWCWV